MNEISKLLIGFGILLIAAGLILSMVGKIPWLGRFPGDILIRKGNFTFYFPLLTCLLVSIILTLLLNLFRR